MAALAGCGKGQTPTGPSDPPAATVFAVDGIVRDASTSSGLGEARVEIVDGMNAGRSATTDAEGKYRLGDLSLGTFQIRAIAAGFDAASRSVSLSGNASVEFALTRSQPVPAPDVQRRTLSGTVTNAANEAPIRAARIEVESGPDRGASTETDARGGFSLSLVPGSFSVVVSADGFVTVRRDVHLRSDADARLEAALEPKPPAPPSGPVVSGSTLDGTSNEAIGGAVIRTVEGAEATSAADGRFMLALSEPATLVGVTVTSATTVDRATHLKADGQSATLHLMPRSLNLAAFDQMFRGNDGELHRWMAAPRVIIERRVLEFTNLDRDRFTATAAMISDEDLAALRQDLEWGLPQLTGDTFDRFGEIRVETSEVGAEVEVARPDAIVVAQYAGLTVATSFWGYSRWAWNNRGEMRAATMMLDRDFETSGSAYRRSLRVHELGHALGYNHVDLRESAMNGSARVLPTTFDRHGSRIAFLRPPLNRTPDADPEPITISRQPAGGLTWTGAH